MYNYFIFKTTKDFDKTLQTAIKNLPTSRSPEDVQLRENMFEGWDVSNSGSLSLAEVHNFFFYLFSLL